MLERIEEMKWGWSSSRFLSLSKRFVGIDESELSFTCLRRWWNEERGGDGNKERGNKKRSQVDNKVADMKRTGKL